MLLGAASSTAAGVAPASLGTALVPVLAESYIGPIILVVMMVISAIVSAFADKKKKQQQAERDEASPAEAVPVPVDVFEDGFDGLDSFGGHDDFDSDTAEPRPEPRRSNAPRPLAPPPGPPPRARPVPLAAPAAPQAVPLDHWAQREAEVAQATRRAMEAAGVEVVGAKAAAAPPASSPFTPVGGKRRRRRRKAGTTIDLARLSPDVLGQAFVLSELLGPPLAMRDGLLGSFEPSSGRASQTLGDRDPFGRAR